MTEQDRSILRVCVQLTGEILTGSIRLHPDTHLSDRLSIMLIDDPAVWEADDD